MTRIEKGLVFVAVFVIIAAFVAENIYLATNYDRNTHTLIAPACVTVPAKAAK